MQVDELDAQHGGIHEEVAALVEQDAAQVQGRRFLQLALNGHPRDMAQNSESAGAQKRNTVGDRFQGCLV